MNIFCSFFTAICFLALRHTLIAQTAFDRESQFGLSENVAFNELKKDLSNHSRSIDSVSQRISDFQNRFKNYKPQRNPNTSPHSFLIPKATNADQGYSKPSFNNLNLPSVPIDQLSDLRAGDQSDEILNQENIRMNPFRIGYYFLPFLGLQSSGELEWSPTVPSVSGTVQFNVPIKQKIGIASGWRMGKQWNYFFIDGEFTYFRNDFADSMNVMGASLPIEGDTEGYSVFVNAGLRFNILAKVDWLFGAGTGYLSQEFDFTSSGLTEESESSSWTYQIFSGLNFYASEHLLFGVRYRLVGIKEMNDFSSQDLHLAELSMGYIF